MTKNKGHRSKKEAVRKAKYSTYYCIKWILSRMWQWDKSIFLSSVIGMPIVVILYALGLYTPSVILNRLQTSEDYHIIVLVIIVLLGAGFLFNLIHSFLSTLRWNAEHRNAMRFYFEIEKIEAKKDYFLNFDEEFQKTLERAKQVWGNGADGSPGRYLIRFFDMAANALCFLLFGSVVSTLNPIILLLLVVGSLITLIPRRYQQDREHEERDERNANSKKLHYLSWRLSNTLEAGKDIRIYNFTQFLTDKMHVVIDEHTKLLRHQQRNRSLPIYVNFAVGFIRDASAYVFLIHGAVKGKISAAEFVLYFNAISQLSGFIDQIIQYFGTAHEVVLGISDCITFFDEPHSRMNHGTGIPLPKGRPLSVEFCNVSYKYPKGEKNVLEDISFRINEGEKISLVGLNGAGKTTLTKLMCGLLLPDSGEIRIDGHLLQEYNRDELYTLFSIVSQDYTILPTTIAENVAFCDRNKVDEKRLWSCLEKAQIAEKIRSLSKGIDTSMDKQSDEVAVFFSGGEMQRLLLARAIYHEASIMILDEPTAALDPIAEDNMYQKYREMTKNVTSVFISHRLASTRFCDRIYLLEGERLVEIGTHEELMALGGDTANSLIFRVSITGKEEIMMKRENRNGATGQRSLKTDWGLILRGFQLLYEVCPQNMIWRTIKCITHQLAPYFTLYMSAEIISSLVAGNSLQTLLMLAVITVVGQLLLNLVMHFTDQKAEEMESINFDLNELYMLKVQCRMQYKHLENPETAQLRQRIRNHSNYGGHGLNHLYWSYGTFLSAVVNIIFSISLTASLLRRVQEGNLKGFLAFVNRILEFVTNLALYLYVGAKAYIGTFGIGNFVLYTGTVNKFLLAVSDLGGVISRMRQNNEYLIELYRFLDLPDEMYHGTLSVEKREDNKFEIEFRNVSFKYPGSDSYALKNVSLKFRTGERMAYVGMNGSGKSTFVKLLCRLYDPTEGQILLKGIDISKYDYDQYLKLFSVVFQDLFLFSFSLGENISAQQEYDEEKVRMCLQKVGFGEKLSNLEQGLKTAFGFMYQNDGVEFSEGEQQKIVLARALYKDAPYIILDEPTASLDPIAEAEVYDGFNEFMEGKTTIYISHRLSSCRFADKILVFDGGQIIQQGSHDELVSDEKGKYFKLWNAQAKYYTEKAMH